MLQNTYAKLFKLQPVLFGEDDTKLALMIMK